MGMSGARVAPEGATAVAGSHRPGITGVAPRPEDVPRWDHQYPFNAFHRASTRELRLLRAPPGKRVGVPGHRQYDYDSYAEAALTYAGTIWETVFSRWMFWLYMVVYALVLAANSIWYDNTYIKLMRLEPWITTTLLNISVFTVTFYNASVYGLYRQRYNEIFKLNGAMTAVSALCYRMVHSNYDKAFALLRYANSMIFVNYSLMEGPMTDVKWARMQERSLLDGEEVAMLQQAGGNYSTILLSWAVEIVRGAVEVGLLVDMDMVAYLATVRGLTAKQIGHSRLQVPKPYHHVMWLCMQLFLVTCIWRAGNNWNAAMRGQCDAATDLGDNMNPCLWTGAIAIVWSWFTIVVVFGLYRVAVCLSDPFGEDSTDYDLSTDLDGLWQESLRVLQLTAKGTPPAAVSAKFAPLKGP
mmetsp:Transcript_47851/g.122104  ORF Transcript_47851/g.122104 Transcript_47851/m.122104 type:complete len:412 (-) Transcript_47851:251-1486(-)